MLQSQARGTSRGCSTDPARSRPKHPEAVDVNGDIPDYMEPLHVEVYATHEQIESSQEPYDYASLDSEIAQDASNLLDVGMDSDLDESVDKADFTRRFWDATHPPTLDSPPK